MISYRKYSTAFNVGRINPRKFSSEEGRSLGRVVLKFVQTFILHYTRVSCREVRVILTETAALMRQLS
jgi:hypothetical protein